ncbi:MAG: hypothetical protein IJ415_01220 [Clostridia bacterium]|nr:hypothetical protein [Clostridia bacterium]
MSDCKNPTIAVIDSGIGGVSVLQQVIAKYKAGNFIYCADNLYMPYGNKTKIWLKKRITYLINLLKNHYNVDYIIIACNTASTTISDKEISNVMCMRFNSDYKYFATNLTKKNMSKLNVIADNTLAKQIELHIFNKKKINEIIKRHIKSHKLNEENQFVLGCTHYELVQEIFKKHCPNSEVINNSSFVIKDLCFDITQDDLNVFITLTKKDLDLENKILKLIRS